MHGSFKVCEQVWAGLAHAIISQLVEQIPDPVEREKFWLALQYDRLDFNAIRSDIHRVIFERIFPKIIGCAVVGVVGLLLLIGGVFYAY